MEEECCTGKFAAMYSLVLPPVLFDFVEVKIKWVGYVLSGTLS